MAEVAIVILSGLFLSSAVMATALWIAWHEFGGLPHARAWSLSFAAAALQAHVNAAAVLAGRPIALMALSTGPPWPIQLKSRYSLVQR